MQLSSVVVVLMYSICCYGQYNERRWKHENYNVTQTPTESCLTSTDMRRITEEVLRSVLEEILGQGKLNDRIYNLESQVGDQFNVLKTIVLNTESKMLKQNQLWKNQHRQLKEMIAASTAGSASVDGSKKHWEFSRLHEDEDEDFKSGDRQEKHSRDDEINEYNNTVSVIRGKPVFRYYWKIDNIGYKISGWGINRSERSPTFEVQPYGYNMFMRVTPKNNHLGESRTDYFSIHVGVTQGLRDHQLEWPFKLQHRVAILDHSQPPADLTSRLWDPTTLCSAWNWRRPVSGDNHECVGLGVPVKELKTRKYLYHDSLVLRLSVIME